MKYISFLLLHVCFASLLKLDVGIDPELPSCGSHCMVDSMFVTQCMDMTCLCHQKEYQQSLFQCLYSQCDTTDYGQALSRTISTCMDAGAEIYMVAPGPVNMELLRAREVNYLAGRQLPEVSGLQIRQESVAITTVTMTFTDHATLTLTPPPPPSPMPTSSLTGNPSSSSFTRPWVLTQSRSSHLEASYSGLVLWIAVVLLQDYLANGQ
ncbi:hypothetical protein F5Y16DRAFT_326226 [Xylariaceae sp. FL0255]|nr:hypothetical protein F5Y16DRAFT_326226 [Xylariaceae sp. FL0255]